MRPRGRRQIILGTAAVAVALAGCGGGSGGSSSTSASSSGAPSNGEASKPAAQILADTEAALTRIHSVHAQGTEVQSGQTAAISGDIQLPGRARFTIRVRGAGMAQVVAIGATTYLNADTAFFEAQGSSAAVAAQIGNRWVRLPATSTFSDSVFLASAEPSTIGHCLVGTHLGTVTVKGRGTYRGQPVVILANKGDVPGSTPGLMYVAATGPPLPLYQVQTGRQHPGGTPDPICHQTKSDVSGDTSASTVEFTAYDAAPAVTAPAGAVDLATLTAPAK